MNSSLLSSCSSLVVPLMSACWLMIAFPAQFHMNFMFWVIFSAPLMRSRGPFVISLPRVIKSGHIKTEIVVATGSYARSVPGVEIEMGCASVPWVPCFAGRPSKKPGWIAAPS